MKLPRLPQLKRRHNKTGSSNETRISSKLTGLKPMPGGRASTKRLGRSKTAAPQFSTVDPAKEGWGGETWFETDCGATDKAAVGGTCGKCGAKVRAIDLRLRRTKDGDEYWKCIWC